MAKKRLQAPKAARRASAPERADAAIARAAVGYRGSLPVRAVQVPRGAYFPSDVVAGALIGFVSEALVDRAVRALRRYAVANRSWWSRRSSAF